MPEFLNNNNTIITITNLFIALMSLILGYMSFYYGQQKNRERKLPGQQDNQEQQTIQQGRYSYTPIVLAAAGVIAACLMFTWAITAIVRPDPDVHGWNSLPGSISALVKDFSRFVNAVDRFIAYWENQPYGDVTSSAEPFPASFPLEPTPSPYTPRPTSNALPSIVGVTPTIEPNGFSTSTPDWSLPAHQYSGNSSASAQPKKNVLPASELTPTSVPQNKLWVTGNIVTCALVKPSQQAWVNIYRHDGDHDWVRVGNRHYQFRTDAKLKIDGLQVDIYRWGNKGHPYRVELVVNNVVVKSIGNTSNGENEFRVLPNQDNFTNWPCPYPLAEE